MSVAVALAVMVVVMGVGVAVALVRARAVGGDEDNGSNSDGGGPYNNQLKGPVEETTAVSMVTATDTATAISKAMEKHEINTDDDDGASGTATKTSSPGCTLRLETSPMPWHSVLVAMMVRKIGITKIYIAQLPPIQPIIQLFCCCHRRLL